MSETAWRIRREGYADRDYEDDENGYTLGVAVLEGQGWAWGVSAHGEGRNEPAILGEGKANSMEDAMKKADACWTENSKRPK